MEKSAEIEAGTEDMKSESKSNLPDSPLSEPKSTFENSMSESDTNINVIVHHELDQDQEQRSKSNSSKILYMNTPPVKNTLTLPEDEIQNDGDGDYALLEPEPLSFGTDSKSENVFDVNELSPNLKFNFPRNYFRPGQNDRSVTETTDGSIFNLANLAIVDNNDSEEGLQVHHQQQEESRPETIAAEIKPNSHMIVTATQEEMVAIASILLITCNQKLGYLHKQFFKSGGRGNCIKVAIHDWKWFTPSEFEAWAGWTTCTKWSWKYSISISYYGWSLGSLITKGWLTSDCPELNSAEDWGEILEKHINPVRSQLMNSASTHAPYQNLTSSAGQFESKEAWEQRVGSAILEKVDVNVGPNATALLPVRTGSTRIKYNAKRRGSKYSKTNQKQPDNLNLQRKEYLMNIPNRTGISKTEQKQTPSAELVPAPITNVLAKPIQMIHELESMSEQKSINPEALVVMDKVVSRIVKSAMVLQSYYQKFDKNVCGIGKGLVNANLKKLFQVQIGSEQVYLESLDISETPQRLLTYLFYSQVNLKPQPHRIQNQSIGRNKHNDHQDHAYAHGHGNSGFRSSHMADKDNFRPKLYQTNSKSDVLTSNSSEETGKKNEKNNQLQSTHNFTPTFVVTLRLSPPYKKTRGWDKPVAGPVYHVRSNRAFADLHKEKFGSGTKGKCIQIVGFRGGWYTPSEFVIYSSFDRTGGQTWADSIYYGETKLQTLIDKGILFQHSLDCNCNVCSFCCEEEIVDVISTSGSSEEDTNDCCDFTEEIQNAKKSNNAAGTSTTSPSPSPPPKVLSEILSDSDSDEIKAASQPVISSMEDAINYIDITAKGCISSGLDKEEYWGEVHTLVSGLITSVVALQSYHVQMKESIIENQKRVLNMGMTEQG